LRRRVGLPSAFTDTFISDTTGLDSHPFPLLPTSHHNYTHLLSGIKTERELEGVFSKVLELKCRQAGWFAKPAKELGRVDDLKWSQKNFCHSAGIIGNFIHEAVA
jgi:hypothetical protein